MKEILYIQAGSLANYIGTHFWNTQESYFTYETEDDSIQDSSENPPVLHDISFREGISGTGDATYCPRVVILDRKANFGTLSQTSSAYFSKETDGTDIKPWNGGNIVELRQEPLEPSDFHKALDEEELEEKRQRPSGADLEPTRIRPEFSPEANIRYWSDYCRVYYIPRSIHRLPDPPDWELTAGDWDAGRALFNRYDQDAGLMEGSVRLFLEECDSVQGIQVTYDTATFGGFTGSFLTSFRDEYLKLPCLSLALLSDESPNNLEVDDFRGHQKVINDALCLRSLDELSSMSVPLKSPDTWKDGPWKANLNVLDNIYRSSAVLSTHIEGSTLPLRLKKNNQDLSGFCSALNWRGITRFANLSGAFPFHGQGGMAERLYDFSAIIPSKVLNPFTRLDVCRGFSTLDDQMYDLWAGQNRTFGSLPIVYSVLAYPIPSSFPRFFEAGGRSLTEATTTFSSVSTTSATSYLFSSYARFLEKALRRNTSLLTNWNRDDLKELANDLWTLHDNFSDGNEDALAGLDAGESHDEFE